MRKNLRNQKVKGLIVYYKKCRSDVHGNSIKAINCNHPFESQSYKAIIRIPHSGNQRKIKILKSRNFEDALLEFAKFKKEVKNPLTNLVKITKPVG